MKKNRYHLTYCTNIHPGESWNETFENLKRYIPQIKAEVSQNANFGIGLRLSDNANRSLLENDNLSMFKSWLNINECFVFTLNSFPYGGFHHQKVKDQVHKPDWTTTARFEYTHRLFQIMAALLPAGIEGGISTSPLLYKYWESSKKNKQDVLQKATHNIIKIAEKLINIHESSRQILHLDIEPEPDGLLEKEVIDWYTEWLIPQGIDFLQQQFKISNSEAEAFLKRHIRLCYDVCHFAIVYEKPEKVFSMLKAEGIKIGKIQISAALKISLPAEIKERINIKDALVPFVESTYLHQVVERDSGGGFSNYRDLPQALKNLNNPNAKEWRTHFHVPVFLASYGVLESTLEDILEVFNLLKKEKITEHLEIETYT